MPDAEFNITEQLVRSLLERQFPALAALPLRLLASGWDNTMYRLGSHHIVRLPRRQLGADLIEHEQRWLPVLSNVLPLPIPAPTHVGEPSDGYPWTWSIVPWVAGVPGDTEPLDEGQAVVMADFLRTLHQPAPAEAPVSEFRGMALSVRKPITIDRLASVDQATDLVTSSVRSAFHDALDAPLATEKTWVHGDLHPRNIVVHQGEIASIIDWGDMNGGDGANDLAALWMFFDDPEVREAALAAYGATAAMTARAKGWAVFFGAILTDVGLHGDELFLAVGSRTLRNVAYS